MYMYVQSMYIVYTQAYVKNYMLTSSSHKHRY